MSHKIGIKFNVDTAELKKLNELSKTIDDVRKKLKDLPNATKPTGGGGNSVPQQISKDMREAARDTIKMSQEFKEASKNMSKNLAPMNSATTQLIQNMGRYHENVKTTISDSGKMTATFKELDGSTKKVSAQFNEATGQFEDFSVKISAVGERARKTKETLVNMSPDPREWNVFKHAVLENAEVIGAVDKGGGKFKQTLVDLNGKLHTITGQYNKASGEIRELTHETKAATDAQMDMAGFSLTTKNRIGTMADSMKGLNRQTLSVGDSMRIAATRMLEWSASATLIYGTKRAFQAMLDVVLQVDTQMTELKKVMSDDTDFEKMLDNATIAANKFGQKLTEVNESLIEFGRQGLNENQIKLMTDATLAMANVGDIDAGTAASKLTGVIATFKTEYTDAMRIVDKFNEVQNNFPITVEDSSAALEKAGSTASAFGVSLDETLGHVVAITQVTRESGSVVGNSLKTIYSRLLTMDESVAKIEAAGVKCFDEVTGSVRPVNDVLTDLAGKWNGLSEEEQQALAITIAGRQQLSRFLALMDNYSTATEATATSQKSFNSAMKENQKYMESLQAKINVLKTKAQELALTMGDKGIKKAFGLVLEGSKDLLSGLNVIIDKFGTFKTLAGLIGTVTLVKLAQQFHGLKGNTSVAVDALKNANLIVQDLAGKSDGARDKLGRLYAVMGDFKTGLGNLAATVFTNPFTWVAVAITAIVGLVGWLDNIKKKNQEIAETAKTAEEANEEFVKSIAKGKIDQTSLDMHIQKTDELKKGYADAVSSINDYLKDYDASIGNTAKQTGDSMASIIQGIEGSTKVSEVFTDAQRDMYAQMGINAAANGTIAEFMKEYKEEMANANELTKEAETVMKQQKDQAIHPLAEEYEDLAGAISEADSALQIFLGTSDEDIDNLWNTRNTIVALQELEKQGKITKKQKEELTRLEKEYAEATDKTVESIKKNGKAADKYVESKEKEVEATGKASGEKLKDSEIDTVVTGLSKKNEKEKREAIEKTKQATKQAEENRKKAYESKQADLFSESIQEEKCAKIKGDSEKKKQDAIEKTKDKSKKDSEEIKKSNDKVSQSNKDSADKSKKAQGEIQTSLETSKAGFFLLGDSAKTAEGESKKAGDDMKGKKGIKGAIDSISTSLSGLCGWWDDFKEKCKDPITGKITIKGILGGIFGDGGDPNAKIKEAAEKYAGGSSIAGRGFGGLRLTSPFGMRKHPISGKQKFHSGIDLAGPAGTPIRARAGGVVTYSGYNNGYGNMVQIRTNDGTVYRYAHNQSNSVKVGSIVAAGQTIGYIGSTGNSTGPHIHFEVRKNGVAINPTAYYHSGGIVDKQRKTNEVDARLQVGEMVLTHSQQSNLFKMLSNKNHSKLNGQGMDEGGSRSKYFGQGGPTYSVRAGDTLSEIAVKYYGNAYSGGLTKLLKLNPKLSKNSILQVGQKINVPSSNTKTSTTTKKATTTAKKLTKEQSDKQSQAVLDYMSKMEGFGASGYDKPSYKIQKLIDNKYKFNNASNDIQQNFNDIVIDSLSQYTDKAKAEKLFKQAGLYDLNASQKKAVWKGISAKIDENIKSAYDAKADKIFSYMSEMEGYGAKGYSDASYDVWKMQANRATFTKASADTQKEYNSTIISALHEYTNAKTAKTLFNKSGFFGLNKDQLSKIWQGIQESINENILQQWTEKTSNWLDTFTSKLKEAGERVQDFMTSYNNMVSRKKDEAKTSYVDSKVNGYLSALGLDFEKLTEAEKVEKRMQELQQKITQRAEENAQLQYGLATSQDETRIKELKSYIDSLNERITKTSTDMKKQGITDTAKITEAQQPLKDKLAEVKAEYNELTKAISESNSQVKANEAEMNKLAEEYKQLEKELSNMSSNREFTDMWGNLVHSAEGATVQITENGQILLNTYANIKRELEAIKNMSASGAGVTAVVAPILDSLTETIQKYAPSINTEINPADAFVTTNNDSTIYKADTNSNRNVTYVVQTGVALASESELREFAMVLAGMIEEERARGNS